MAHVCVGSWPSISSVTTSDPVSTYAIALCVKVNCLVVPGRISSGLIAGGSYADRGEPIGGDGFQQTFAVNVQGIANAAAPVFAAMKTRGKGQIAIMASTP